MNADLRCFSVVVLLLALVGCGSAAKPPKQVENKPAEKAEQIADIVPSGEQPYRNSLTARTTGFALRKSIRGMTKQNVEREIGVGELALAGGRDIRVYPMLLDASLDIEYENDRAVEVWISVEGEEESHFGRKATGEDLEELRKALHNYEIEHKQSHER